MSENHCQVDINKYEGTTLVSCPGKVLVVGGYLVLEREHEGLVFSTDARFYSWVVPRLQSHSLPGNTSDSACSIPEKFNIRVKAAQFNNPPWNYVYDKDASGILECPLSESSNKFVFQALDAAYRYLHQILKSDSTALEKLSKPLDIFLLADNDFYSQRKQLEKRGLGLSFEGLSKLPKCGWIGGRLEDAHKTGLGSSACLVSSLVGAIIKYFQGQVRLSGTQEEIHRIAQYAHCKAQGKVGSGFDVSAAIFGSHIYRRFTPTLLSELFCDKDTKSFDGDKFLKRIREDTWDHSISSIRLPPRFHLALGEVDEGSNTPSMVSQVLKWKIAEPTEAQKLWYNLSAANSKVAECFSDLHKLHLSDVDAYNNSLNLWVADKNNGVCKQDSGLKILSELFESFQTSRTSLRHLSNVANVPIEPPEQTKLLDLLQEIPSVIIAGVPGAGGYDAVFAIFIDPELKNGIYNPIAEIQACFDGFAGLKVGPLLTCEDKKAGLSHEDLIAPAAKAIFSFLNHSQL